LGAAQTVTVTGGNLGGNCFLTFSDGTRQASVNIINCAGNFQPH
jgi:hypothetical protein